MLTEPGRW